LRAEPGAQVTEVAVDLARQGAPDDVVRQLAGFARQLDILVCCAGEVRGGTLEELDHGAWTDSFAVKFFGTLALIRRLTPLLKASTRGATIVVISGNQGFEPRPENIIAGALNGALHAAIKALSLDLGRHGVRVLGVSPGAFDTDRLRTVLEQRSRSLGITLEEARSSTQTGIPLGRVGKPEELAELVAFLVSDRARYMNGSIIAMDGGARRGY